MKIYPLILLALLVAPVSMAETERREMTVENSSEVFARMGDVIITQGDFDAFIIRRQISDPAGTLASNNRLETILDMLLTDRLLAQAAIDGGLLEDEQVQAGLLDNAYTYLASRQLQRYLVEHQLDDYSQQAREIWLTGNNRPAHSPRYDFTHLLVSTHIRSDAEAARIALDLHDQLEAGADFSELIEAHSDDPSVEDNQGSFTLANPERLEPEVAAALEKLEQPGSFHEPVRSRHGWHIIRLDERHEGREKTYEEALPELEAHARSRHRDRLRSNYLSSLATGSLEIEEGAVEKLFQRYGVGEAPAKGN